MFEGFPSELLVVALVALIVIGPKDLPRALRFLGKWVGRARGVARQFRTGLDDMIRESELADLKKQWEAENERIMRDFPTNPMLPAPHPVDATVGMPVDEFGAIIGETSASGNTAAPTQDSAAKPRRPRATKTGKSADTSKPAAARKPRSKVKS